jgi:hypothetical protein
MLFSDDVSEGSGLGIASLHRSQILEDLKSEVAGVQDARVSKASRFTRGKPGVPHCVYTGWKSQIEHGSFLREGKAGRFTYGTAL